MPIRETSRGSVGIAVIGCGRWGVNYVRLLNSMPDAHVAVLCEQREERLDEVARQFRGVPVTTSLDEALADSGVRAAIVCTPARTHADVISACLEASKDVLVEKPLTTDAADADRVIELAREGGLTLMVGHTFLYNPAILKLRELVRSRSMGRVYYLYSRRTNLGPIRGDVNALWDLASHDVAIFHFLLGQWPAWVSAVGTRALGNKRHDVGFVALAYRDEVVGHIHASWVEPNKVRELVVVGSRRRVVCNDLDPLESVRIFERGVTPASRPDMASGYGDYPFNVRDGDIVSPRIEASEPLRNQVRHFLDCIVERRRPMTDGVLGQAVVRVLEAIDRSLTARGAPAIVGDLGSVVEERDLDARTVR